MRNVLQDRISRKVSGPGVNINCLGSALTAEGEDAVKAFFVYGGNPVGSVCDQKAILKGLMREDLFTVVHERFLTDTARYADILLPAVFFRRADRLFQGIWLSDL